MHTYVRFLRPRNAANPSLKFIHIAPSKHPIANKRPRTCILYSRRRRRLNTHTHTHTRFCESIILYGERVYAYYNMYNII